MDKNNARCITDACSANESVPNVACKNALYIQGIFIYTHAFTDNSQDQQDDAKWPYEHASIDIQQFLCLVGRNIHIVDNSLEIYIFELFFTDKMLEAIVAASNEYAESTLSKDLGNGVSIHR